MNRNDVIFLKMFTVLVFVSNVNIYAQNKIISKPGIAFFPSIKSEDLDLSTYADWVDNIEKPIQRKDPNAQIPQAVLWTDKTESGNGGVTYGVSKKAGPRYLRLGFNSEIAVGSLIVDGGGTPGVLKPGAAYPGNLNDDSQWISAQRMMSDGQLSDKETGKMEYALWVFPPGTKTRAIRFSHKPELSDNSYEGWLGGVVIAAERFNNVAPLAMASARSFNHHALRINNGMSDNWDTWSNKDYRAPVEADAPVVSAKDAEWILLTWSQPVSINGLLALWAGFSTAEVQSYTGPATQHPRDADEKQWQTIADYKGAVSVNGRLWPNRMDFGKTITTNAVRIRITGGVKEAGNLKKKSQEGKRVWVGEIMALQPLAASPFQAMRIPSGTNEAGNPPVAVPFTLKDAGYVTLVIEDKNGMRVRNLVSETWFNAGKNIAWWDGLDDLGRDVEAAKHGVYKIPARFVAPGDYKVRGLVRGEITTSYEFPIYSTGTPPWTTDDHLGGWLANHTPPQAAVFVPSKQSPTGEPVVYLGNYVTEGPDGLAWVDLDGKKLGGKKNVGGHWTSAPYMSRDAGDKAAEGIAVYVASVWETDKRSGLGELRVTGLTAGDDKAILREQIGELPSDSAKTSYISGLAVYNGLGVVSLPRKNQLLFIDVKAGKIIGSTTITSPRGLAFDSKGQLLVLSSNKLIRFNSVQNINNLPSPQTLIASGLESPVGITLDPQDGVYITDAGQSHQVKVFSADGKFLRAIGKPGPPKAGLYDPLHMNNPAGLTIDSKNHLWVTENDFLPKRVSVWTLDGNLVKAFYGPSKYGGGGSLDPQDKTKFYYSEETKGSMEFRIDWKTGESQLQNILYRKVPGSLNLAFRSAGPETVIYSNGKRYFTNCFNSSPTSGHNTAFLFVERDNVAYPAAAMGRAEQWDILKEDRFKASLPPGVDLNHKGGKGPNALSFFIWTDLNGDAQVQTDEVVFKKGAAGGVSVMNDLSFTLSHDGNATQFSLSGFTSQGVPIYKMDKGVILAQGVQPSASSGGNQILAAPGGWTVAIQGILPFDRYSISGAKDGKPSWSYPNLWPGLHASHEAPLPGFSGQLIGPTRLLGGLMDIKGSSSGPLWAINSNHGMVYIFTSDGLFVATLFEPMRAGKRWRMPTAQRGMSLKGITLGEENFWPTITQTKDEEVYIVDGARSSLVKVDGLKNIQRLPVSTITINKEDLEKSRLYQVKAESLRQKNVGSGVLKVAMRAAPVVDGKLNDWSDAEWVDIDKSGVKANFNSNSKPYDVTGAVAVSGDRLYVAYRTGNAELLKNTGEMPMAPFKTGGALDLMIGSDPASKSGRQGPVAGDSRLLVTIIKGKPKALLYRAVVAGTKQSDRVPFASPWRTIAFDRVDDVTAQLSFAASKEGDYEISLPLCVLGLSPKAGMTIKGDIGILRGDGAQTFSRVYWSNKATGIVSDVPAEAELTPALWGTWEFK